MGFQGHGIFRSRLFQKQQGLRKSYYRTLIGNAVYWITFDDLEWPLTPVEKVTRGSSVKLHCKRKSAHRRRKHCALVKRTHKQTNTQTERGNYNTLHSLLARSVKM